MNLAAIRSRVEADRGLPVGRRSFYLAPKGRSRGSVLLLHGFSASPYELRQLGAHLQSQGIRVYAPRLAGHGIGTAAFNAKGRHDWLSDAEAAFAALRTPGQKLNVIGHSMGGVLAALVAAKHGAEIRRLVLAAPAFHLADPLAVLCTFRLVRALKPDLHFKALHPDSSNWTLDYASSRINELILLGREGAQAARSLRLPLFLLQSKIDPLVSRPFNERLFPAIPSEPKTLWVYEAAEHNVFHRYNPLQDEAFRRVAKFLL